MFRNFEADSAHLLRLFIVALLAIAASSAYAGGLHVREDTVVFNNGLGNTVLPNQKIALSFSAEDYEYGSNEYKYVLLAVVRLPERLSNVSRNRLSRWTFYPVLRKTPLSRFQKDDPDDDLANFKIAFSGPSTPGQYAIIYNRFPWFTRSPLRPRAQPPSPPGESFNRDTIQLFEPDQGALDRVHAAATRYGGDFTIIKKFEVAEKLRQDDTLPVYLRVNGEVPLVSPILGGITDRPLTFSWRVGAESRLSIDKVRFRYQLWPDDDGWSDWSNQKEANYFFLPKGKHRFRAQAIYKDQTREVMSSVAQFEFTLDQHRVAKPSEEVIEKTAKQFPGARSNNQPIQFDKVYANSRALIVGVWNFDDVQHFPIFPRDKIENDVNAVESALINNGFTVKKLFESRLTREQIVGALETLISEAKENDRLFVYFSSHGFADRLQSTDGYIATSDCMFETPSVRCLRLADLENQARRALTGAKVRQVLFAVDSCFAGLGIITKSPGGPNLARLALHPGAFMLTAGMSDQIAQIDPQLKMSTFTHFLAEGLKGKADFFGDGTITLTELLVYIQYEVARKTGSQQIPMLGRMVGNGEMIFRPKN